MTRPVYYLPRDLLDGSNDPELRVPDMSQLPNRQPVCIAVTIDDVVAFFHTDDLGSYNAYELNQGYFRCKNTYYGSGTRNSPCANVWSESKGYIPRTIKVYFYYWPVTLRHEAFLKYHPPAQLMAKVSIDFSQYAEKLHDPFFKIRVNDAERSTDLILSVRALHRFNNDIEISDIQIKDPTAIRAFPY
jgi:hypothetical protein